MSPCCFSNKTEIPLRQLSTLVRRDVAIPISHIFFAPHSFLWLQRISTLRGSETNQPRQKSGAVLLVFSLYIVQTFQYTAFPLILNGCCAVMIASLTFPSCLFSRYSATSTASIPQIPDVFLTAFATLANFVFMLSYYGVMPYLSSGY